MYRIIRGIAAVLIILTVFCTAAFAEKKVVTAEGKYVMGDLDSKQNAKALALMEAKRISLEKAGTYIESISEVRDFQLTKDQINSLAAGIMSVEILKEDWKMSGENMVLILSIRATIDTSNLDSRIAAMNEYKGSESNKEIMAQLESLKKELADLKTQQLTMKDKTAPQQEMKAKNETIINKMASLDNLKEGQAALQVQNHQEAINSFKRALEIDPNLAEAYAGMSLAYQGTKERGKALEMANTALKIAPRSAAGHYALSRIMYTDEKYDQSLESINRAIGFYPRSPFYFLHRADIYLKQRNSDAALKDYAQACTMNLYPACQRVDIIKKRIAENKSGDDLYRSPGLPDRQPITVAENIQAGHAALQAQNYKEALKAFTRAHNINPKLAEAYAGMSLAYQGTREKEKALEMVNTALKIAPRSATGNYALSKIKYTDGKHDQALEYVNAAIRFYSDSPYYYLHRAEIYMKLRNNESALKDYEKSCKMNVSWGCKRAQIVKQQMGEIK
jgi:tetratricopeptide (TPR) repeat protein